MPKLEVIAPAVGEMKLPRHHRSADVVDSAAVSDAYSCSARSRWLFEGLVNFLLTVMVRRS